jgi:hypothetical protein
VQVRVTELLLTLLEGNTDTTIPTTMISTLNFSLLLYHAEYLQPEVSSKRDIGNPSELLKKRRLDLARNTFRLIKMLGETDPSQVPDEQKNNLDLAFSSVNSTARSSIGRIEIITADRALQRLYFPIPASCQPNKVGLVFVNEVISDRHFTQLS